MIKSWVVFLIGVFLACAWPVRAGEVTVSSGVGLRDAVTAISERYRILHPEVTVRFNFAASGPLAKQIEAGAPVDIFLAAHSKWMDYLVSRNKVKGETVRIFAGNGLVVAGPKHLSILSLTDLTGLNLIAIGMPGSVPVGDYAVESFRKVGIYDTLVSGKKLVMARDVRQALTYADWSETDVAVVYRTDVRQAEHAVVLYCIPDSYHERILYTMALTLAGEVNAEARAFYDYLGGGDAKAIIMSQGFDVSSTGAHLPAE